MNLIIKIFFSSISIFICILLVLFTLKPSDNNSFSEPDLEKLEDQTYYLQYNNEGVNENTDLDGTIENITKVETINTSDRIYSRYGDYEVNGENISLTEKGIFIFEINSLNKSYKIENEYIDIQNNGPGIFLINTKNDSQYSIFSFNGIIDTKIKNDGKIIEEISVFPHSYFIYNPKSARSGDLLRISQIYKLGYATESVENIKSDKSEIKFRTLLGKDEDEDFLYSSIDNIYRIKQKSEGEYNKIKDFSVRNMEGEGLIERFYSILLNDSKKTIYLKNRILKNLNYLSVENDDINSRIDSLIRQIEELKKVNTKEYEYIINLIDRYYKYSLSGSSDYQVLSNVTKLNSKMYSGTTFEVPSIIFLRNTYFDYDFNGKENLLESVSEFNQKYRNEISKQEDNASSLNYILFYLEKVITAKYNVENIKSANLVKILSDYSEINMVFYENQDSRGKRTGLTVNEKILERLAEIIRDKYFEEEKSSEGLLVRDLSPSSRIDIRDVNKIEEIKNSFYTFFKNNSNLLDSLSNRDSSLINSYKKIENNLDEYILALSSPDEYKAKFDQDKSNLINADSLLNGTGEVVYDIDLVLNYFSTFSGLVINRKNITAKKYNYCIDPENGLNEGGGDYCFEINNSFVNGKSLSFIFYPYEGKTIDSIDLGGEKKNGSYDLEKIQDRYIELYESAKKEEKEKYEFKNFFLTTFRDNISTGEKEIFTSSEDNLNEEDKFVREFKRTKLLGSKGDFTIINDFIDVNYNDLLVERKSDNSYSIFINGSILNKNVKSGNGEQVILGQLYSKYIFIPGHEFINPEIKLFKKDSRGENIEIVLGNRIEIIGNFRVSDIEKGLEGFFKNIFTIDSIANNLNSNFFINETGINITYNKDANRFEIKSKYKNKDLIIYLLDNDRAEIIFDNKYISDKNTNTGNINTLLNTIK